MLVETLNITMADLLPAKDIFVVNIPGEPAPRQISRRLHQALSDEAAKRGLNVPDLLRNLVHEIGSN